MRQADLEVARRRRIHDCEGPAVSGEERCAVSEEKGASGCVESGEGVCGELVCGELGGDVR